MSNNINILIASREKKLIDPVEKILKSNGYCNVETELISLDDGHSIYEPEHVPDVLILSVDDHWQEELTKTAENRGTEPPALVVLSVNPEADMLKMAIRVGADDVLNIPVNDTELINVINRLESSKLKKGTSKKSRVVTFMSAQGGSGSTFLSVNMAYALFTKFGQKAALIDLDMTVSAIPLYLDLYPKRGICQALQNLDSLDEEAMKGYFISHPSGIDVLSSGGDADLLFDEPKPEEMQKLIKIASHGYSFLIIDVPRQINALSRSIILNSSKVVLVMNQSLVSLASAKKIINYLLKENLLTEDELIIVVNKYDPKLPVSIEDINKAIKITDPILVPEDLKTVAELVNTGTPFHVEDSNKEFGKSIISLAKKVSGLSPLENKSTLLSKVSSIFNGKR